MRLGKIGSAIRPLIKPLQQIGAMEVASNLELLSRLLEALKDEDAETVVKAANRLALSASESAVLVRDVAHSLSGAITLAQAMGSTASRLAPLREGLSCLSRGELANAAFSDFAEALQALFDVDVVELHLAALEGSLGTERFDDVFKSLEKDRRVKKPELAAIASRFISRTSKSAPKGETLKRIYSRHASLLDSANKLEWQKGKSAA